MRAYAVQSSLVLAALLLACFAAVVVAPPPPSFTCDPSAGNDVAVCAILGEFYTATNGSLWGTNSGWSSAAAQTPTDYCGGTFTGIASTCVGGNITQLCVC